MKRRSAVEIWAQLLLCDRDCRRVIDFFKSEFAISQDHVAERSHITVYHARAEMPGVHPTLEPAEVVVEASDTRFMVMVAGGEVARPGVLPSQERVGIRIRRQTAGFEALQRYRQRLLAHETPEILRGHRGSTSSRSAFGAPRFQPHMVLLRSGSPVPDDLTIVGRRWRETMGQLTYDRFLIDISRQMSRPVR